jgi:hypothetical protein
MHDRRAAAVGTTDERGTRRGGRPVRVRVRAPTAPVLSRHRCQAGLAVGAAANSVAVEARRQCMGHRRAQVCLHEAAARRVRRRDRASTLAISRASSFIATRGSRSQIASTPFVLVHSPNASLSSRRKHSSARSRGSGRQPIDVSDTRAWSWNFLNVKASNMDMM